MDLTSILGAVVNVLSLIVIVKGVITWAWRRLFQSPKMSNEELLAEVRRGQWLAEMRIRRDVLALRERFRHVGMRLKVRAAGFRDTGARFNLRDASEEERPPDADARAPWWRWWRLWSGPEDDRPRRPSLPPHG